MESIKLKHKNMNAYATIYSREIENETQFCFSSSSRFSTEKTLKKAMQVANLYGFYQIA